MLFRPNITEVLEMPTNPLRLKKKTRTNAWSFYLSISNPRLRSGAFHSFTNRSAISSGSLLNTLLTFSRVLSASRSALFTLLCRLRFSLRGSSFLSPVPELDAAAFRGSSMRLCCGTPAGWIQRFIGFLQIAFFIG